VAALPVAALSLDGVLLAAGGNVVGTLLLAHAVEVASCGCIKARVAVLFSIRTLEAFWSHSKHP